MRIKSKKLLSAFFLALTLAGVFSYESFLFANPKTVYAAEPTLDQRRQTAVGTIRDYAGKVAEYMKASQAEVDKANAKSGESSQIGCISTKLTFGLVGEIGCAKYYAVTAAQNEVVDAYNRNAEHAAKFLEDANKVLEISKKQPFTEADLNEMFRLTDTARTYVFKMKGGVDVAKGVNDYEAPLPPTRSGICTWNILSSDFDPFVCAQYGIALIAYYAAVLASWFLGFCGLFFDAVLRYTVVEMKGRISGSTGEAINAAWATIRDFGNLIFIFLLLWVAIQTILDYNSPNTKRMVRNLIIVGLLVNFSLFFTKVAIDASNILSITIYRNVTGLTSTNAYADVGTFSGKFMQPLGLMQVWSGKDFDKTIGGDYTRMIIVGIGATIFALLAGFTFLYAGILFLVRFVVLVFLMILSPLAFFSSILPQTEKYKNQWFETLTGQLIFAPLYMILIYAVMLLTNNLDVSGGGCTANIISGLIPGTGGCTTSGSMSAILKFILIIFFMNMATVIATKQAQKGGGIVSNSVGWVNKKLTPIGHTAGTFGFVGRQTIGRTATRLADKEGGVGASAHRLANSTNVFKRALGKSALGTFNKAADATYDARNTAAMQSMAKTTGTELGTAAKTGFKSWEETKKKEYDEIIEKVGKDTAPYEKTRQDIIKKRNILRGLSAEYRKLEADKNATGEQKLAKLKQVEEARKEYNKAIKQGDKDKKKQQAERAEFMRSNKWEWGNPATLAAKRMAGNAFFEKKPEKEKEDEERTKALEGIFKDAAKEAAKAGNPDILRDAIKNFEIKNGDIGKFDLGEFIDNRNKDEDDGKKRFDVLMESLSPRALDALQKSKKIDKDDHIKAIAEAILNKPGHAAHKKIAGAKPDSFWYIDHDLQKNKGKEGGEGKGGKKEGASTTGETPEIASLADMAKRKSS